MQDAYFRMVFPLPNSLENANVALPDIGYNLSLFNLFLARVYSKSGAYLACSEFQLNFQPCTCNLKHPKGHSCVQEQK